MSIISVKHDNETMGGVVVMMQQMKFCEVIAYLNSYIKAGEIDYVRAVTNRVISDPDLHESSWQLVSYCNTIQLWLNAGVCEKLEASVTDVRGKSEEALKTAVAAQTEVAALSEAHKSLIARMGALEESMSSQKGPKDVRGREIRSAPPTAQSMSEFAKKAGQKVIQDQRDKRNTEESFRQKQQMQRDTVLAFVMLYIVDLSRFRALVLIGGDFQAKRGRRHAKRFGEREDLQVLRKLVSHSSNRCLGSKST